MSVFLSKPQVNVCLGYLCTHAYYAAGAHTHLWKEEKKYGRNEGGGGSHVCIWKRAVETRTKALGQIMMNGFEPLWLKPGEQGEEQ